MSRFVWCCCLLAVLSGCGPKDERVSISGVVELDGKPLGGATVAFVSLSVMSSAYTDSSGKFEAKVGSGKNKVSVSKLDPNAPPPVELDDEEAMMGSDEEVAKMMENLAKDAIPSRYGDPATSGLEFDMQGGMAPLVIGITSN